MADENIYARVYKNGHKTFLNSEHEFLKHMMVNNCYYISL